MIPINHRKKRTREELLASILSGAMNGASKTRIMYFSFLSFDQLQKYLAFALEAELLSCDNNNRYSVTSKGMKFLKYFEELQAMEKDAMEKRRVLDELLQNIREEEL